MHRPRSFRLAAMSPVLWILTAILLPLPAIFLAAGLRAGPPAGSVLAGAGAFTAVIYAGIYLYYRPTGFELDADALTIVWPIRRQSIPRSEILGARIVDQTRLRQEIGLGLRVGAGGLWGGFGWLWTTRRGLVDMYVSRVDGFVWVE